MIIVLAVIISVLLLGILLYVVTFLLRKRIPLPDGEMIYSDSKQTPGEIIKATTVPLIGKPDYILKKDDSLIPIEIKTGKTPVMPYKNHIAQLFAYCLLIQEHFDKRPEYGIIRYPDKEVPLAYTESAESGLRNIIDEIIAKKRAQNYRESLQQVCSKCRNGDHS